MKWKYGLLVIPVILFYWLSSVSFNPAKYNHLIDRMPSLLPSDQADKFIPLPQSVISRVKYFVFFVGRSHSGHSIVGSILDSHPHMIIAHEANIFYQLKDDPMRFTSKADVFNELWRNSYNVSHSGGGFRSSDSIDIKKKGYTLQIRDLYQGTYLSYVNVIGDKNGGKTVSFFHQDPLEWGKIYNKLKTLINIPFKVIYVIRNPYDSIASTYLYRCGNMSDIRNSNGTFVLNGNKYKKLAHHIQKHFDSHQAIMSAKKQYNLDLLEIHVKDLVKHPVATILKMCDFLKVRCSHSYVQVCSKNLFKTESKIRYKIKWTADLISEVENYIVKYNNLLRYYSFDS